MHEIIKIVASYAIILPVILVAYVFFTLNTKKRRLEFISLLLAGGILSLVIAKIGSHLIYDPRPFVVGHFTPLIAHANDNGFPSDHTLLGSFLGFILLRYNKWAGAGALLFAAAIGLARVAAGVHHLMDIIGSFVITGVTTLIVLGVLQLIYQQQAQSHSSEH